MLSPPVVVIIIILSFEGKSCQPPINSETHLEAILSVALALVQLLCSPIKIVSEGALIRVKNSTVSVHEDRSSSSQRGEHRRRKDMNLMMIM